ncbi:ABC transporter substrate-binding protein [Motiliproteus sp.]|uniref:ABC transporter substrate-binding protein n=1 Tax=Motiliproteus sp. TaxID=1898955 RepID=UPI003BA84DCB
MIPTLKADRFLTIVAVLLLLQGCGEPEPIKIGFIGGTSGRVADLGVNGRNAAILATEQVNARGGINDRPVELLIRDDQQNPKLAAKHATELTSLPVTAIIGPMTSAMAVVVEPIATASGTLVMGTTVTTNNLTGRDDLFFRTLAATRHNASHHARYQLDQGIRSFSLIMDTRNRAYTQSWVDDFSEAFKAGGGTIIEVIPFVSSTHAPFPQLARQLVETQAQGIALVSNSVDAALLIQHIRKYDLQVQILTSEWAGTERLIELGGQATEGVFVSQYLDRSSKASKYLNFRDTFMKRFGQEPGFPALVSYNSTQIVFEALRQQRQGESLKQALLRIRTFEGVQKPIRFDDYGDTKNRTYITQVINGRFRVVE